MTFRLSALARSTMVVAMLLASLAMLAPPAAGAQNDRGLIDETSYQSPQFGYSVTWADPWETRDRDVITNPGGFDTLTLRSIDGTMRISGRSDDYNPLTFLQDTIAIQLASGGEVINQDTTGAVPTAELLVGRDKMRIDVISIPEAGAIVLLSLRTNELDYDAVFASAQQSIQVEGEAVFSDSVTTETPEDAGSIPTETPVTTETRTPESTQTVLGAGIDGNGYTSPNFGYSITWDPSVWTVPEEAEYSEPDYDYLRLEGSTGPMTVIGWKGHNGNASSCLIGEQTYYNDPAAGISEWQVAIDADGNELTGESETNAWGVFTNVYTTPDTPEAEPIHYVDYIECVSLGDGESVVIFHSYAVRDVYNEHVGHVLGLVETLELPAGAATPPVTPDSTPTIPADTPTAIATTPVETPTAAPTVETQASDTPVADQGVTVGLTELTWTGNWQLDAVNSIEEQATLTQVDPATGSPLLASYGEFADITVSTPEEALNVFAGAFIESSGASDVVETGTGTLDSGAVWKHQTFELQGMQLSMLITVSQPAPGRFTVSTLTGNTATFESTLASAQQEILLDGEPAFLAGVTPEMVQGSAGSPTATTATTTPTPVDSTPASSPADLTTGDEVTGETFSYRFAVPAGWQVSESTLGGEIERTVLSNGTSTVAIEGRAMTTSTLTDCVSNVGGEHADQAIYTDLALARTASGDPFSGEDDFSAFANFTFTGPDGQVWAHFIECRWIVQGESALVVIQDVPQEAFGSERAGRRQIQNSIEVGQ